MLFDRMLLNTNIAPKDPYFSSVSLLLNGDGTNGSQVFTDLSPSPKTITAYGNAQISTSTKKYGTGSMSFDGNGDYLSIPSNTAFNFGTGDFTIEGWIYVTDHTPLALIIYSDGGFNNYIATYKVTASTYKIQTNGGGGQFVSNTVFNTNTWYHIAISKSSGTARLYINGTNTDTVTGMSTFGSTSNLPLIGYSASYRGLYYFNGYIDDLRITKGIARYTANFTPPTSALPTS